MSAPRGGGPPTWRGEGVRVGEVLEALEVLRRAEERAATRTSVVNLVVVAPDEARAERATTAVRNMGGRHPGRSVVVVCEAGARAGLDAEVMLHAADAEGRRVWSEDIRLHVRGRLGQHLDSLIEPLTLPDVPVVVWFTGEPPGLDEPLLSGADAVVVDTRDQADQEQAAAQLATVAELEQRHTVLDLAWIRLRPWRTVTATLFEPLAMRPFLDQVTSVRVTGKPGARLLLGGWLSSRLGLPGSVLTVADGRHASFGIRAGRHGPTATVTVTRAEGERAVHGTAEIDGEPVTEDRVSLPEDAMSWSLAEALTHLGRDRVHAQALQAALAVA